MSWWEGVGLVVAVGGKPKAGYTIHRHRDIVSSVKHRNSHSVRACQAKMVVASSLTPHAALLVGPSGTTYLAVDHHEFQGQKNVACESRSGYL